ncbi:acyltransferase family protein [Pedobacter sp. Leaf132]|uniref:acyltransferase family protein n=1 Tax=Pedobacter sp. Leaf132 TaxID=2876557 RepID=UPI00351CFA95
MQNNNSLLNTKKHFEILDGLRGVAAISVVLFHFMEIIFPPKENVIVHSFLAVDFFFCLSGFVIAYAYDSRIAHLGVWQFIKLRLIRLHPLVVIGSVLGLLTFFLDPFSNFYPTYGFGQTLLMFLASVFLIPYPLMEERFFNLFNLNAPAWSLFWEYIANIFYVFVLYKFSRNTLQIFTFVAAALICFIAFKSTNLMGGWSGPTFWDGGARVLYSFLVGMLIFRSNWAIKNNIGFLGLSALLLLAFIVPFNDNYNWLTEPLIVLIYFPVLVALGAGATIKPKLEPLCKLSGEISYPLYMIHYPFIWVFLTYFVEIKPEMALLKFTVQFIWSY